MLIWVAADENPRLGGLRAKNDKKCSGTPKYNTTDTFLSKVHLKDTYSSICVVCVSISQDKASLSILNSERNRKKKNNKIKQFLKNLPWNPVNMDKCPFKRALRKNVTDTWCIDLKTKADIYNLQFTKADIYNLQFLICNFNKFILKTLMIIYHSPRL